MGGAGWEVLDEVGAVDSCWCAGGWIIERVRERGSRQMSCMSRVKGDQTGQSSLRVNRFKQIEPTS